MKFSVITLFPEIFPKVYNHSILGRAQKKGLLEIELINLRDFGKGSHKQVDDRPFGGGIGMVLKPDVLAEAVRSLRTPNSKLQTTILLSASGKPFSQSKANKLSKLNHIILICGHYEGVDQRFIDKYVDEEISIGDYVLTGGEIPAMVLTDAITRLIPGVLIKKEATEKESFSILHDQSANILLLEHPQYTRPEEFEDMKVPDVLLSGNHQEIIKWRQQQAFEKTSKVRPDLFKGVGFSKRRRS